MVESGQPTRAVRGLEWVRAQRRARLRALRLELEAFARQHRNAESRVLEIGCGHGHWLAAYAAAHPGVACVGLDLKSKRIRLARRKAEAHALGNLKFFKAEATEFLEATPPELAWDTVCLLFPDPWPKAKHHKNRLLQQDFLDLLSKRTRLDAAIFFRTDDQSFFEWTRDRLEAHPGWGIDLETPWIFEHTTYFQEMKTGWSSLVARRRAGT